MKAPPFRLPALPLLLLLAVVGLVPRPAYASLDPTTADANARAVLDGEKRPSTRDSQALLLSVTQAVSPPLHKLLVVLTADRAIAWAQANNVARSRH